jgi:uncharacterized protein (DUF952 family)
MIIYHLVPIDYLNSLDAESDYFPKPFAQEGFIHTTEKPEDMASVANQFYKQEAGPHVYLYIEASKVKPEIRYQDPERKFPHIYGGLNRDAIIAIKPALRDSEGNFLPPE